MYLPNRVTITVGDNINLIEEEPVDWVADKVEGQEIEIKGQAFIIRTIKPIGDDWKVVVDRAPKA